MDRAFPHEAVTLESLGTTVVCSLTELGMLGGRGLVWHSHSSVVMPGEGGRGHSINSRGILMNE